MSLSQHRDELAMLLFVVDTDPHWGFWYSSGKTRHPNKIHVFLIQIFSDLVFIGDCPVQALVH